MANSYNSAPIVIDTVMGSSWRASQTLNTGTITIGGTSFSCQPGIKVTKVSWTGMTAQAHTFTIVEPVSSAVLLSGVAGAQLVDQEYDFVNRPANWRDFQVTGLDSGKLLIWYRV